MSRFTIAAAVAMTWFATEPQCGVAGELPSIESDPIAAYESDIVPILQNYCYDCHGYGEREGNFVLDQFSSGEEANADPELWWNVVKNLRAGVMPPVGSPKLKPEELARVNRWIKFGPFGIDPENPDPGPITVRRMNRQEYGNTVRSLMGVDFDETLLFPPDDSGHGFDNVADALMVSPLLLDKYLQAAEMITERAVPRVTKIIPRQDFRGHDFTTSDKGSNRNGRSLDGKKETTVSRQFAIKDNGRYNVSIGTKQHGSFEFDPARYKVICRIDDELAFESELGWDENKLTEFDSVKDWDAGDHKISFQIEPIVNASDEDDLEDEGNTHVHFEIYRVSIEGPLDTQELVHPQNYDRFFTRDSPPEGAEERRQYAAEVLERFATRAFRGKVDRKTVDRLVSLAEAVYSQPETTFESGISRAIVAVLASPRFLFRIESAASDDPSSRYALVDELSLASRLSYFLWSSMPDNELVELAEQGKLRENLESQVDRMLADKRADAFIRNFVGQWLRTRDVVNANVDANVILGYSEELEELREWFKTLPRGFFRRRGEMSDEDQAKLDRFREIRRQVDRIDDDLKRSIRRETEEFVEYVIRNEVSLLDLLDCDYTFLDPKLADHYGIEGVKGEKMRRVELPEDSPRGGLLTQASMLMVTSNPTRTSPVKRGLFILDNILGTPAPPAPGVVPELEESADRFDGREPTLRELLAVHREDALCASCHARMDPIGLALENFDALGMWRDSDNGSPIEPQGELVTGETFSDIRELKKLLRENHADDFYRCVTEKLLVFAIGRGMEYTDEHTVDQIVEKLRQNDGKFSVLVKAVIESAPFQKQRLTSTDQQTISSNEIQASGESP
ncbi:DUF1592 domain-containing protein [Stieleria sp. JC731]|uniref:DUF1592 domain-containing protein n=1 Tax=Pirellulaceae TaxID=2691357 RepID=UPI001E501291|nr:DUF1592 domain-containing protein [Stieleria sp. JC731]MCC9601326.1 DUF1592 domain-containing protein [Stieleria sp. JC731]